MKGGGGAYMQVGTFAADSREHYFCAVTLKRFTLPSAPID